MGSPPVRQVCRDATHQTITLEAGWLLRLSGSAVRRPSALIGHNTVWLRH
jgi:hypothetical protein